MEVRMILCQYIHEMVGLGSH